MPARNPENDLHAIVRAGLAGAHPENVFDFEPPRSKRGRTIVLGAGKASCSMAVALERQWTKSHGGAPLEGLVVTRRGYKTPTRRIEVLEAGHPVPDSAGVNATKRIVHLARSAGKLDTVIALISGGGSSLLVAPRANVSLSDKQEITRALLKSGAPIQECNTVRQALSDVKAGGLLAAIRPATVITYVISDVVGDDPALVASGPTIPQSGLEEAALEILQKHNIDIPRHIARLLQSKTDNSCAANVEDQVRVIASADSALRAATIKAEQLGYNVLLDPVQHDGDSKLLGQAMARLVQDSQIDRPTVYLSGGETTVTVTGSGRGGPNTEFLLSLAIELDGAKGIHAIAIDTDGTDGTEDNAGAIIGPDTIDRARRARIDGASYLRDNDAYSFFKKINDLVGTGPTGTNVNDLRAILVL